jgi:hypothetical protein
MLPCDDDTLWSVPPPPPDPHSPFGGTSSFSARGMTR